jgi:hypothetical protein
MSSSPVAITATNDRRSAVARPAGVAAVVIGVALSLVVE